jgi:2,4-dienoyl-CoA reductase (NADPH2)
LIDSPVCFDAFGDIKNRTGVISMTSGARFKKLMEPSYIGKVRLRNRIIKTAAGTGLIEKDGTVGETMKGFYETMAKGGVGLIIYEFCSVEYPRGMIRLKNSAHFSDDKLIPSYSGLVDVVHKHGCPFFMQLMHSGPWFGDKEIDPGDRVAPSTLTQEELPSSAFAPTRELSIAEIEELIEKFAKAAERAQKAGFDGIEINGSHHHLINTFFSRFWNRRHDDYGCDSLENRARFMGNIVREVKNRCGEDYPVTVLFNAVEYGVENGTTLDEAKVFARLLQEAGAEAIQLRAAGYHEFEGVIQADRFFYPELPKELKVKEFDWSRKGKGVTVPLGAAVKQAVSVPVFVACRLDPELGEEVLRQGKLDFIGMTRRLLADPELPNKIAAGRLEDIAPCSGCNYCWHRRAFVNLPLRCRINAAAGREREFEVKPADKKKKVLIAGGGPAGLEAARVAALRGHEVILYEKEPKLGGSMPLAAILKDIELENILSMIRYFKIQLTKLGVTMRLGKEVTQSVIEEIKPDVLILAIGGAPTITAVPGINRRKVIDSDKLRQMLKSYLKIFGPETLERLTKLWMPVGKAVVIIGGALQGCELAEFLVKRGRKVAIVDTAGQLGEGMISDDPDRLFKWLNQKGATMMAGVKYEEITDEGLVITTKDGERKTLKADTIITALPLLPNTYLLKSLEGKVPEIYQIGDCREPAFMPEAIADGSRIARVI